MEVFIPSVHILISDNSLNFTHQDGSALKKYSRMNNKEVESKK